MTEKIVVSSKEELSEYRDLIVNNIRKNVIELKKILDEENSLHAFYKMKFDKIAVEPLSGHNENVIEVINQFQTYMVSIKAAEYLLEQFSDKTFTINWGNIPGYDIESNDGEIIAECFATTSYKNNDKLNKDLKRLQQDRTALFKYEFFFDKEFTEKQREYYENKFADIKIIKFYEIN